MQWLRDGLRAIENSGEVQSLAPSVPDSGGVMLDAHSPAWARPTGSPMRAAPSPASHAARRLRTSPAALRSIAYQSAALLAGHEPRCRGCGRCAVTELRVDGGASVNNLLMQFQADLLGIPVVRPACVETTALGAAYLAGLSSGMCRHAEPASALWKTNRTLPTMQRARAAVRYSNGNTRCDRPRRNKNAFSQRIMAPRGAICGYFGADAYSFFVGQQHLVDDRLR